MCLVLLNLTYRAGLETGSLLNIKKPTVLDGNQTFEMVKNKFVLPPTTLYTLFTLIFITRRTTVICLLVCLLDNWQDLIALTALEVGGCHTLFFSSSTYS